jgi:aminoglycoside phosphotransferase (APT) family kinase protein
LMGNRLMTVPAEPSSNAIVVPRPVQRTSTDGERPAIESHLHENAARYGASDRAEVVFLRSQHRAAATLYWYRISGGVTPLNVVVKVPREPADRAVDVDHHQQVQRPRLVEPPPLDVKYACEYAALELVQRHFSDLDDARFGVIPVLDRIHSVRAIVMEEVNGKSLKHLFAQLSRLHPGAPSQTLRTAVENAGAWLRRYHQLDITGTVERHASRVDFEANVQRYCSHLGVVLGQPSVFADLASQVITIANRLLPAQLPLGLAHNDFAMRNILVADGGRITVFDTTAVYRTPVYADLAKFVITTRLSRVQAYTHGAAFSESRLQLADRWLFAGYYGKEPAQELQIRLYALLMLLDKWSFELAVPVRGSRLVSSIKQQRLNSWYMKQADAMVRVLEVR